MKTLLFIAALLIGAASFAQTGNLIAGDSLIGKDYEMKMRKPSGDSLKVLFTKVDTLKAVKPLQFTPSGQLGQQVKSFDTTYTLYTDSVVIDYSKAGFTKVLSDVYSPKGPGAIFAYTILSQTLTSATLRIYRATTTVVNLTGTTVQPFTPAGAGINTTNPGSTISVSIRGY